MTTFFIHRVRQYAVCVPLFLDKHLKFHGSIIYRYVSTMKTPWFTLISLHVRETVKHKRQLDVFIPCVTLFHWAWTSTILLYLCVDFSGKWRRINYNTIPSTWSFPRHKKYTGESDKWLRQLPKICLCRLQSSCSVLLATECPVCSLLPRFSPISPTLVPAA